VADQAAQSGEPGSAAARFRRHGDGRRAGVVLQRSPNILLIAGTSSVARLRGNVSGASLTLSGRI